jgi:hypothetical protein
MAVLYGRPDRIGNYFSTCNPQRSTGIHTTSVCTGTEKCTVTVGGRVGITVTGTAGTVPTGGRGWLGDDRGRALAVAGGHDEERVQKVALD